MEGYTREKINYEEMLHNVVEDGKVKIELHHRERFAKSTFINNLNNHLNNSLRFADTKAGALVAANGLIAKFLVDLNLKGSAIGSILFKCGLIAILFGIFFSIFVVLPRTKNSKKKDIIYWDNIANMEMQEYTETVSSISNDKLFEKQIENNYFQAVILKVKFRRLRTAFLVSMAGYLSIAIAYFIKIV